MLHFITAVLIVLKSLGYFNFSWWIVVSPSLIAFAIVIVALITFGRLSK